MKWILLKTDHVKSIIFDFKHAGTLIKVQTRHMVLIIIQSRLVKTADEWETDQLFSGPMSDQWPSEQQSKSCEEHSIIMYRGKHSKMFSK